MAYANTLEKLSENLLITYKNTIFSNPGDVGDSREKEVINYLRKVMANKYGFKSGEVFDKEDNNAGQVDIIIYDNLFSTVFSDGTDKVFSPVESTYGIISVKSKMGTKELDHAIEGIQKYNNLKRPIVEENTSYILPDLAMTGGAGIKFPSSYQKNINCIFAFDTTVALQTIQDKIKNSGCIDLLVVPGKICFLGRERKEFGLSDGNGPIHNCGILSEKSVPIFTILLQMYLSCNRLIAREVKDLVLNLVHESKIFLDK